MSCGINVRDMEWIKNELSDARSGIYLISDSIRERARDLGSLVMDRRRAAIDYFVAGALIIAVGASALAVGKLDQIDKEEKKAVAEQARLAVDGYESVQQVRHEQPLISGDKDIATIELTDGSTCTVILSMPGAFKAYPQIGNYGDCPLKKDY